MASKIVNGIKKLIEQETKLDEIQSMKTSGIHESVKNGKNSDMEFKEMEEKL